MPHKSLNYDNAIAITKEIYWVGFYDEEAELHCNPYILIDDDNIVLFDPGSIPHFPKVMRKILDIVNPTEISHIVASHQDPDVCGNIAVVEDVINRDDLKIAAHTNTIRLVRHYGVASQFYHVDKNGHSLKLSSGRTLDFIHTPCLHSPGAIVTYDRQSKSLFTGDIFGAINSKWSLFAGDDYLRPMDMWHQQYMPSNELLRSCMNDLEKLDIERILPQHGSVLEGEEVARAIDYLKELPCLFDVKKQSINEKT